MAKSLSELNGFLRMTPEQASTALDLMVRVGDFYPVGYGTTGHGRDDHIASVISRATDIAGLLNEKSDETGLGKIDVTYAKLVAAYHDVGAQLSRDGHNHFGFGIVNGDLTPKSIVDVPCKDSDGNLIRPETTEALIEKYLDGNGEFILSSFDEQSDKGEIPDELSSAVKEIARIDINFDVGYNGIPAEDLPNYICEKYGISEDSSVCQYIVGKLVGEDGDYKDEALKGGKDVLEQKSEKFHELTKITQDVYAKGSVQLKIIAEGIQDHNIDNRYNSNGDIERYEARSIYGMITADADKSNSPVLETMRNYLYTTDKFVKEGKDGFVRVDENGNKIKDANGNYVMNDKVVFANCIEELGKRHAVGGKDAYLQIDNRFPEINIEGTMYGNIRDYATLAVKDDPKSIAIRCELIDHIRDLVIDVDRTSGEATSIQEDIERGAVPNEKADHYVQAVYYYPTSSLSVVSNVTNDQGKIGNASSRNGFVERDANSGVFNVRDQGLIRDILSFKEKPSGEEIQVRAITAASIFKANNVSAARIITKQWMNGPLAAALEKVGIQPLFPVTYDTKRDFPDKNSSVVRSTSVDIPIGYTTPDSPVIVAKAEKLADVAEKSGAKYALCAGAPWLMPALEKSLAERNITPVYSYSSTHLVQTEQPDNSRRIDSEFKHTGFVSSDLKNINPQGDIINLTKHPLTADQKESGVIEPKDKDKDTVREALSFQKSDLYQIRIDTSSIPTQKENAIENIKEKVQEKISDFLEGKEFSTDVVMEKEDLDELTSDIKEGILSAEGREDVDPQELAECVEDCLNEEECFFEDEIDYISDSIIFMDESDSPDSRENGNDVDAKSEDKAISREDTSEKGRFEIRHHEEVHDDKPKDVESKREDEKVESKQLNIEGKSEVGNDKNKPMEAGEKTEIGKPTREDPPERGRLGFRDAKENNMEQKKEYSKDVKVSFEKILGNVLKSSTAASNVINSYVNRYSPEAVRDFEKEKNDIDSDSRCGRIDNDDGW